MSLMRNFQIFISSQKSLFRLLKFWSALFFFAFLPLDHIAQNKDTVYIGFDEQFEEMRKEDFTRHVQAGSPNEKLGKSITYYIRQKEPPCGYGYEFHFTHANHPKKAYEKFGGTPPIILHKEKSFLRDKKVLDINFFRTIPYQRIAKTFEEEDSWKQDVRIFMIDVDEIKNDSITLREVTFGRPVKE